MKKKISQCDENFNKKIECLEQKLERSQNHYDEVIKDLIEKRIGKIEDFQKEKLNEKFFSKQSELIAKNEQLKEEIIKMQEIIKEMNEMNEMNEFEIKTFTPENEKSFDGIINYLGEKTGGNIHDNGTIEVTSNSILRPGCHPKYLLQSDDRYATIRGDKNAWVCFDFKNMKIEITDYRIQRGPSCNIKNWIFEISNDGNNWTTIDQHYNCDDLEKKTSIKTFKVQKNHLSRFCRIRHNGEFCDYNSGNTMQTDRIEFYGKLKEHKTS